MLLANDEFAFPFLPAKLCWLATCSFFPAATPCLLPTLSFRQYREWVNRIEVKVSTHKVHIFLENLVGIGTPHPLPRKRVCPPPPNQKGGCHTHLRVRGVPIPTTSVYSVYEPSPRCVAGERGSGAAAQPAPHGPLLQDQRLGQRPDPARTSGLKCACIGVHCKSKCCGSIPHSWFLYIPDTTTTKICPITFFVATNVTKMKIILFLNKYRTEKKLSQLTKN